jgi:transposase
MKKRLELLEEKFKELKKENNELKQKNGVLVKENALLLEKVIVLEKRLLRYENPHTPPSLKREKREPKEPFGKLGAPIGHKGVTRPEPKPDKIVDAKPLEKCPACKSELGEPDGIAKQFREDIPRSTPYFVTLFNLPYHYCKNCGTFCIAQHPDCPEKGRFGYNLLSNISLLKFDGRLPHRKIVEALKRDFELKITPSTVMEINKRNADKLSPKYNKLVLKIRKSLYVYVDETGLRVNGAKYWVWIFITSTETLVVIRPSRGKNVLEEILTKNFNGIIICDGWKTYPNFTMKIQRCWAHLLREVKDLSKKFSEMIPLYEKIATLFTELKDSYRKKMSKKKRQDLWKNAMRRLKSLIKIETKKEAVQKMIQKIKNGLNHWFTFILHPEIEPTNNTAERGLREIVVQRKIFGCLRNEKGTTTMETIMSLFSTWKMQGLNLKTELLKAIRS